MGNKAELGQNVEWRIKCKKKINYNCLDALFWCQLFKSEEYEQGNLNTG